MASRVILCVMFIALAPLAARAGANDLYHFVDNQKCDLRTSVNQDWEHIDASVINSNETFYVIHHPSNPAVGVFKVGTTYYSANNDCLLVVSVERKLETKSTSYPSRRAGVALPSSFSIGFEAHMVSMTSLGVDGNKYPLEGHATGLTFEYGSPFGSSFLGYSIQPFLALLTMYENATGTPTPTFLYEASGYFQLGVNVFLTATHRFQSPFDLQLKTGLGIAYASLPAPGSNGNYAAPASTLFYFLVQLQSTYYFTNRAGVFFGAGVQQSFNNFSGQMGIQWKWY